MLTEKLNPTHSPWDRTCSMLSWLDRMLCWVLWHVYICRRW